MGILEPLRKGQPILTLGSIERLKDVLENKPQQAEAFLNALYFNTHDLVQQVLIEDICKLRGYTLFAPEENPPKSYA